MPPELAEVLPNVLPKLVLFSLVWGIGASTDTGHKGSSGSFGMLRPGVPDVQLQTDFGWRSEQMMAVVSKQLIAIFYGKQPIFSYWNGFFFPHACQNFTGRYAGINLQSVKTLTSHVLILSSCISD